MGNSLRCWLACVLPCGALDLVRVVHLNGHVDEYSRHITAGEILAANPRHVLSKPCSQSQGLVRRRILIVSPETELKRGHIYFLIPGSATSVPENKEKRKEKKKKQSSVGKTKTMDENIYLSEENLGRRMRRRSSTDRVSVWRPHLESIDEDPLRL